MTTKTKTKTIVTVLRRNHPRRNKKNRNQRRKKTNKNLKKFIADKEMRIEKLVLDWWLFSV